jgi:hypothetical protein
MRCLITLAFLLQSLDIAAQTTPCLVNFNFDPGDTLYQKHLFVDTANPNNLWQAGKPSKALFNSAFSVPNAFVTDSLHPCPANDTSAFVIRVPQYILLDTATQRWTMVYGLSFTHRLDIAAGDSVYVDMSLDSGKTWQPTTSPYDFAKRGTSTMSWQTDGLHLIKGPFSTNGELLYIRFMIKTGTSIASRDGWVLDDITVGYWCESHVPELNKIRPVVYPNPSEGNITISGIPTTAGNLSVYTPDGRKVYETKVNSTSNIHLPVPPGLYVLKYTSGELHTTEKIIVR